MINVYATYAKLKCAIKGQMDHHSAFDKLLNQIDKTSTHYETLNYLSNRMDHLYGRRRKMNEFEYNQSAIQIKNAIKYAINEYFQELATAIIDAPTFKSELQDKITKEGQKKLRELTAEFGEEFHRTFWEALNANTDPIPGFSDPDLMRQYLGIYPTHVLNFKDEEE